MRFVRNILSIDYIMSFFTKRYNTATQIETFIKSLTNYEEILETDPNEFNKEKLCRYISSDNFKEHKQNCFKFCRHHIASNGCVEMSIKKITLKVNPSWLKDKKHHCQLNEMNSAKIVLSIYKLMDRIKNGETGGMGREHVNFFFGQKFNEILDLNLDDDFERVIGKVDCELPPPSFSVFARGKKTKIRRVRKGKGKLRSRRRR
jgi:hypothetical protein